MRFALRTFTVALLVCFSLPGPGFGSAYNAHPRLVVIIVIDQFRGDYLERYHDQFGEGGFRLLIDHGANFTDCNYNYSNTRTAPGHATLLTGAYTSGHGIMANQWWDPQKKATVSSVQDDSTKLVGIASTGPGASPHNLLADTLGDELKLATQGKSRVFGIALKERAAILPAGFAGNGAFWIDRKSGTWVSSTYYATSLPQWAQDFNSSNRAGKYLNKDWTDNGKVFRTTRLDKSRSFYGVVGSTPFANDYELEFARELITNEKLGSSPATDLLVVSLSANDILGHEVGPDSPEMRAMALALDRQLADFFTFLGHQVGMGNLWIALSADHGVSPAPNAAAKLRIPAANLSTDKLRIQLNSELTDKFSPLHSAEYIRELDYPLAWANEDAFSAIQMNEEAAENAVGEALMQIGMRGYYTRTRLARGDLPNTEMGMKYAHSYSPLGGWYVMGVPPPYNVGIENGTDHATPYTYDTHVPLAFYGAPFQPGTYRSHAEPVDLAATLASLLGINAPTHAIGRVLTEALTSASRRTDAPHAEPPHSDMPMKPSGDIKPTALVIQPAGDQQAGNQ